MLKHGDMNQWDAAQDGADTRPGFHLAGFAAANAAGTGAAAWGLATLTLPTATGLARRGTG